MINSIRYAMSVAVTSLFMLPAAFVSAQQTDKSTLKDWEIQPVTLQTRWAKEVSPANALKEYPRPGMVREQWINLNGLWDYAITAKASAVPGSFDGKILVPYPLESALSGVKKVLKADQLLWYKRSFLKPVLKNGEKVILNFGAVDYEATVLINGKEVGRHEGGYTAFSFDVTSALKQGANELVVKVFDPSGSGVGPHGKQVSNPANIYYTASSGIWQTVWMETVPAVHVEELVLTPDIDKGILNLTVTGKGKPKVTVPGCSDCGILKQVQDDDRTNITISIPNAKLWSPANPHLYNLEVTLGTDKVSSYFGMRKISIAKDAKGVDRIMLNNKPYYNLGTLDQGFWPDGLYTAPTDEALAFDIKAIKAMGFNTIRKHIKVEPARWYYHADKLGVLVWQDMVNPNQGLPEGSKAAFEKQSKEIVAQLHNYPSITTYVLFNEKWGQYDQARLTSWLKSADPSRIVNGHSGEYLYVNDQLRSPSPDAYVNSDITDVHSYPEPMNSLKMDGKARVCGEFGGIGVFIPDHQWNPDNAWGYVQEKAAALKAKYAGMVAKLETFDAEGMSGSIYTQPFDVEGEQNGLITYDRAVVKIPFADLRKIHSKLNPDAEKNVPQVTAADADLTDPEILSQKARDAFKEGARDEKTVQTVARGAGKVSDESFKLMLKNETEFRKVMGTAKYSEFMSDLIFNQAIQPLFGEQKSWEEIRKLMADKFGPVGEESAMRIMLIGTFNGKEWDKFVPGAKEFVSKFGSKLTEQEQQWYQNQIKEHE